MYYLLLNYIAHESVKEAFAYATVNCVSLCGQLMKDYPTANLFNVHENLIEALLELQAYADVQALLVKYDGQ